jgi:4-hydroxybenzoate polyprenyltransferase
VFSINDLEDYSSDKLNSRKKSIFFGMHIPNLLKYSQCIKIYNLIIFLILIGYSILYFKIITTLILFLLLFIMYFYSAKPIRLRRILFIDFISNGIIVFLSFVLIYSIFNRICFIPLKIYLVSISIMSYHLVAAQIDIISDNISKQQTSATIINNKHLIFLICILLNLPLLLIKLNSFFKFLFYINILIILIIYLYPKFSKLYLFLFFVTSWVIISLFYILNNLF